MAAKMQLSAASNLKLCIFLFVFLSLSICHYMPRPEEIIRGVVTNGIHSLNRRSTIQSLRIKFVQSPSVTTLDPSKRGMIVKRLLPEAVDYFGKTLKVRRRANLPIRLQRSCRKSVMKQLNDSHGIFRFCIGDCDIETHCGTVKVPTTHLDVCQRCESDRNGCEHEAAQSGGVKDADFVLYVSAISTEHCQRQEDVLAYAAVCQQEQSLERPVAGFLNFCEDKLTNDIQYSHLLAVVKHEIYHALGFSSSLYGYYRAADGTPLTPRLKDGRPVKKWSDKVVKEVVRNHWAVSDAAGSSIPHKVEMVVLPHVLKEVRAHFNCPTLEGAEIENQGATGQRQTHWEKRLFENEAMTGAFTHNPVFSRISLALMEDTGWYEANYDMAESLDWGQNAGCLFAQNSCKAWIDDRAKKNATILPFCSQISPKDHTRTSCTHGHDSVGACNLVKYVSPLPLDYRYFNSLPGVVAPEYYGGATAFADYCPYIQELDWKKNGKTIRGSSCKHESNNLDFEQNYALEKYGTTSACFLHGRKWLRKSGGRTVTSVDWGSGCYPYMCTKQGVTVSILCHSFLCQSSGQTIELKLLDKKSWLHRGSLVCPSCRDLCGDSCPLIERMHFYNFTTQEQSSQQVLACSSSAINNYFVFLIILVIAFAWLPNEL